MVRYTSRPVGGRERVLCAVYAVRQMLGARADCVAGDDFTFNIWQSYSFIRQTAHAQYGARFPRNEKYFHAQNGGGEPDRIAQLRAKFGAESGAGFGAQRGGGGRGGCGA